MAHKFVLFFILAVLLVLSAAGIAGCGGSATSSAGSAKEAIRTQLTGWTVDVNSRNLESLMRRYSTDYLHFGVTFEMERAWWEELFRWSDEFYIRFEEVRIGRVVVTGDTATARMEFNLSSHWLKEGQWQEELVEGLVETFYLRREGALWLIWGNQRYGLGPDRGPNDAPWRQLIQERLQ